MSIVSHIFDSYQPDGYHNFMAKLKELRLKLFISQVELAERAGIAAETVNRLERRKRRPSFITIRKLAKALGVEPGEIEF